MFAAAWMPLPADAHCSDVIVFSNVVVWSNGHTAATTPTADARLAGCLAGGDTHYLYPGSNAVKLRFGHDEGADAIGAHLSGIADRDITLVRTELAPGLYVYDSDWIEVSPFASGWLTAAVYPPSGAAAEVYRTLF
jgi:hypothetical protein